MDVALEAHSNTYINLLYIYSMSSFIDTKTQPNFCISYVFSFFIWDRKSVIVWSFSALPFYISVYWDQLSRTTRFFFFHFNGKVMMHLKIHKLIISISLSRQSLSLSYVYKQAPITYTHTC